MTPFDNSLVLATDTILFLGRVFRFPVNAYKIKQGEPGWTALLRKSHLKFPYLSIIWNLSQYSVKCSINITLITTTPSRELNLEIMFILFTLPLSGLWKPERPLFKEEFGSTHY